MKHVGTIFGAAIAGIFVMSVWSAFSGEYGIAGGWFAGFIIISVMWYLNHYLSVHGNKGAWVDMAVGIGIAGTTRDMFKFGFQYGVDALPTMALVIIGGITGGIIAGFIQKELAKQID
ncbi:MAG: hypothetical protein N4A50_14215 [Vallitalea sp.]|jgi:hypothetical protein|nr:hypothetical protein [Vallitalea sp.]